MKIFANFIFCIVFICINSLQVEGRSVWVLDKELSEVKFELPVLLMDNVIGKFKEIEGFVVINSENKQNNKAFFSVNINSIELNYHTYKELLFSDIFFDELNFPYAIIEINKFNDPQNLNILQINAELQIKNIIQVIPFNIEINHLANNLVQLKCDLEFSRNSYNLGKGNWSSVLILNDKIQLKANLFLNRVNDN